MAQVRETELDIHALGAALWNRVWLLVALTVLAAILTYVGFSFVNPLYTADTRILIENRESPLTRPRDTGSSDSVSLQYDELAIQSQVEVLRSREIADAVIDKLNLTHRPDFDPATQPSLISKVLVMVGLRHHPAEATIRQRVMDTYFKRISVYPLQRSRVLGVDFVAADPDLAAEVANTIANSFVDLQQQAKREQAVEATDWLEQEIDRLRSRVAESETAVEKYRAGAGLYDTSQQAGSTLSTQQLTDINAELARAKAARAEAESRADSVKALLSSPGGVDSSPDVMNSPLIQRLSERQVALRAQIADLSTTLLPSHPRIQALNQQLANLNGQVRQEAGKVLEALNTGARIAAAREQSLTTSLTAAKGAVSTSNDQEIQLRALEREADAQRGLLESFLGRYREAAARTDANYIPADARIISRAVPPTTPSYPKKALMAICAALATLILGSTVVMVREFTTGRAFRIVGSTDPLPPSPESAPRPVVAPVVAERADPVQVPGPPLQATPLPAAATAPPVPETPEHAGPDRRDEISVPVEETVPRSVKIAAAPAVPEPEPSREPEPQPPPPVVTAEPEPAAVAERAAVAASTPMPAGAAEPEAPATAASQELAAPEQPRQPEQSGRPEQAAEPEAVSPEPARPSIDDKPKAWPIPLAATEPPSPQPPKPRKRARRPAAASESPAATFEALAEAAASGEPVTQPERGPDEPSTAAADPSAEPPAADSEKPGAAQLAEILANPAARLVLFAGIKGGEGAGDIAYSSARMASATDLRLILMDIGAVPAPALGLGDEPGLGHLLSGEAAFGEVIRRDDESRVHIIPMGAKRANVPLQRLEMVIGALTHSYDKVVVIADSLDDWPEEHLRPDLAALICAPDATDEECAAAYDKAIGKGARSALIVRFANDAEPGQESQAA